jgi:hypothetical protein
MNAVTRMIADSGGRGADIRKAEGTPKRWLDRTLDRRVVLLNGLSSIHVVNVVPWVVNGADGICICQASAVLATIGTIDAILTSGGSAIAVPLFDGVCLIPGCRRLDWTQD